MATQGAELPGKANANEVDTLDKAVYLKYGYPNYDARDYMQRAYRQTITS